MLGAVTILRVFLQALVMSSVDSGGVCLFVGPYLLLGIWETGWYHTKGP